jgi:hypothetical protein
MESRRNLSRRDVIWDPDALDAYHSFRRARSLFFWVLVVGLLLVQGCFWLTNLGALDHPLKVDAEIRLITLSDYALPVGMRIDDGRQRLAESAQQAVYVTLRLCWFTLTFVAVLYSLTLLIGMKLALVGRLGALGDHGRAFFLSLIVMVLVVPWTTAIHPHMFGAVFSYEQLVVRYLEIRHASDQFQQVVYYVQFVGVWAVTFLALWWAQIRSWRAGQGIRPELAQEPPQEESEPCSQPFREERQL